jgi:CRISPR/Cas system CSM-associated protein Csm2 small subunit
MNDLWKGYLADGYFDVEGCLRPEYVARDKILPIVKCLVDGNLTNHQMRRFFQHCRAIEALLRSKRSTWPREHANMMFIDVAAQDAYGKKKIPAVFHDFIRLNVATTKNEDDFLKGFLPHFEALVGFSSGKLRERERR